MRENRLEQTDTTEARQVEIGSIAVLSMANGDESSGYYLFDSEGVSNLDIERLQSKLANLAFGSTIEGLCRIHPTSIASPLGQAINKQPVGQAVTYKLPRKPQGISATIVDVIESDQFELDWQPSD